MTHGKDSRDQSQGLFEVYVGEVDSGNKPQLQELSI